MAELSEVIERSSEFGARVAGHLSDGVVVWLTTVTPSGRPMPSPVWFLWDGRESLLVYSLESPRVRNIAANPRVAIAIQSDSRGEDIAVLAGRAEVAEGVPPAHEHPAYLEKYGDAILGEFVGMTHEEFGGRYRVPIRIELRSVWGY